MSFTKPLPFRGSSLLELTYAFFLFSQSDLVPIVGPTLAVALVLGGPTDLISFIQGFLWLELQLVTFEIKNQMIGLEEDRLSKPNRPIVSGRISLAEAQNLYLAVGVFAFIQSAYHGLVPCCIVYMLAIYLYNEGGLSRNWFMKSLLGAIGYICYCWGTTVILDHGRPLSKTSIIAIALSGLLHVTTGHAQDFRDRDGDAAIGRKTLPIILPANLARWSLMALVFSWTGGLIYLWAPPNPVSILFAFVGMVAMLKFVLNHTCEADRDSYWWYNMWLISAHMLPVFRRVADNRSNL